MNPKGHAQVDSVAKTSSLMPGRISIGSHDALAGALFAGLAGLILLTFRDYGVTWDEPLQNWYGQLVQAHYLSGGADGRAFQLSNLYLYGALFDTAAAALNLISPLGEYHTRHLLNALVGLLGIAGVWRLAGDLAGPRAGLFAAALLALWPDYYGHMFNNPKDIPFAVGMVWAAVWLGRVAHRLPRPRPADCALLGLAAGLTLGVRVGAVLIFVYLAVVLAAYAALRLGQARALRPVLADAAILAPRLALTVAIAYAVMLLCWPWAQQDPLGHPIEALRIFAHFNWIGPVPVNGQIYPSDDLPWFYLPLFVAIRAPELVLAGLTAGLGLWLTVLWRPARRRTRVAAPAEAIGRRFRLDRFAALVALAFPFAYIVLTRPVMYDGMRHALFLVPLLAAFAGIGFDRLLTALARLPDAVRGGALALGTAALTVHLWVMLSLHPNQYVYFNALAGGVAGAAGRFDIDYWGNSYAEAIARLETYIATVDGPEAARRPYRVAVCGAPEAASEALPEGWLGLPEPAPADFYLVLMRHGLPCRPLAAPMVVEIVRDGVTLSYVRDLRPATTPARLHGAVAATGEPGLDDDLAAAAQTAWPCPDCIGAMAMDPAAVETRTLRPILDF